MKAPRELSLRPPTDMAERVWNRIGRLAPAVRDRVLERAAILIFDGGLSPSAADERALLEEVG